MMPVILAVAGLIGCVGYAIVGMSDVSRSSAASCSGCWVVAVTALAVWSAPLLLQTYGALARAVLGPREDPALAQRVRHLAETRAETIDASAAEIRRIERDLHDGAQARLVAMGMALGAAEDLLDTDPEATRKLLVEARAGVGQGAGRTARPRERRPPTGPRRPGPGRRHPRSGTGLRAAGGGNGRPHRAPAGRRSNRPPTLPCPSCWPM